MTREEWLNKAMSPVKKQGTRLKKVECISCGYVVRITQKWIDIGLPVCVCGMPMSQEEGGDGA